MTASSPAARTSPRVARALIRILLPRDEREFVLGDLEEAFTKRVAAGEDPRIARRWYWRAALSTIAAIGRVDARSCARWLQGGGGIGYDIKFALRSLSRSPSFTLPAIVGTDPRHWRHDRSLFGRRRRRAPPAAVRGSGPSDCAERGQRLGGSSGGSVAPQNFFDWRDRQGGVFEDLAAAAGGSLVLTDRPQPERVQIVRVSSSLFRLLRARPARGQLFTAANEIDGNHRQLVISDALWRGRFGGDPQVIGRPLTTTDGAWTIVAVMPPGFTYPVGLPKAIEAWAPFVSTLALRNRGVPGRAYYLRVIGRLSEGTTIDRARSQMNQVTAQLARENPSWFEDKAIRLEPMKQALIGDVGPPMLALLAAVSAVLLIACANVANMVLARSTARRREIVIRSAIGASRWIVARGVLIENLLLSVVGSLFGVLAAVWTVHAAAAFLPPNLPRAAAVAINGRVLLAAATAAVATGALFGLLPAWQISRKDLVTALAWSSVGTRQSSPGGRVRTSLIVTEIAFSVVLVTGAVLFVTSFARMMRFDTGVDYRRVVSVSIRARVDQSIRDHRDAELARGASLLRQVRERLMQSPGVEAAAWYYYGAELWSGGKATTSLTVPGRPALAAPRNVANTKTVSPDSSARWAFVSCAAATSTTWTGCQAETPLSSTTWPPNTSLATSTSWEGLCWSETPCVPSSESSRASGWMGLKVTWRRRFTVRAISRAWPPARCTFALSPVRFRHPTP